jgi:cell fate regulator YaaT (PSP1 superfamily)
MGCSSCSSNGLPKGCKNNGACSTGGCEKLSVFDWLADMEMPGNVAPFNIIEVRFKNGRKEFFRNLNDIGLRIGDAVAVEGSPGHDVGTVSLIGELVKLQMKKHKIKPDSDQVKKLYRKASQRDIDIWQQARERETQTMYRSRELAISLKLQMKISDVEYQGDGSKAIFYYTADQRVDFRELIKVLANEFKIRVEMRQIGARQEAGRLGGIGSCGRELCCSTWLTDFRTVTTSAARYQQLSLNPQKLAGQCGKLKCCLNYELDSYVDALKSFPPTDVKLNTKKGTAFYQKMDIFKGIMWYSYPEAGLEWVPLEIDRVKEIMALNEQGKTVPDLEAFKFSAPALEEVGEYENVVGQDDLTRFDQQKRRKKGRRNGPRKPKAQAGDKAPQATQAKEAPKKHKPKPKPAGEAAQKPAPKNKRRKPKRKPRNDG